MATLFYHATDIPVRVGDRILVHGFLRRARLATVVYIPGQGRADKSLGDDQWAYKTDDGSYYAVGYFPDQYPHASKRIALVSRAGEAGTGDKPAFQIPAEEAANDSWRDVLALIGCGTLIALVVMLGIGIWMWTVGR